jgi:hypothetical protein
MRSSILDRYFLALMTFVFGWAFFWIPAVWVKRGDFRSGSQLISRVYDPRVFWCWVVSLWVIAAFLMLVGIFLAVRGFRLPAGGVTRATGPRPFLWFAAAWFVFMLFAFVVQFMRT